MGQRPLGWSALDSCEEWPEGQCGWRNVPWAEQQEIRLERWVRVRVRPWRMVESSGHTSVLLNLRLNSITTVKFADLEVSWLQDIDPDRYPSTLHLGLRQNPEDPVTSPLRKRHSLGSEHH